MLLGKIILMGKNLRGYVCLAEMLRIGYRPWVIEQENNNASQGSIKGLVKSENLQFNNVRNINDQSFVSEVEQWEPDLIVLAGFNQILRKTILNVPKFGVINLHGGKLPHYRGGSPINWQIINGETEGACTVLYADEGIDTGDILAEECYDIGSGDTAGVIYEKTKLIFPRLLGNVLEDFETDDLVPKKQDLTKGTYYCKRYPKDGLIDWRTMNAKEIHNLVRGLNGHCLDGAFTYLNGKKIVLCETELLEHPTFKGPPGRIVLKQENGVVAIAKDIGLLMKEISIGDCKDKLNANDYFKIDGSSFYVEKL